jgi:hypothetical protein
VSEPVVLTDEEREALGARTADCGCCTVVDTVALHHLAAERAAHEALREAVERLADTLSAWKAAYPNHAHRAAWFVFEDLLRADLAATVPTPGAKGDGS